MHPATLDPEPKKNLTATWHSCSHGVRGVQLGQWESSGVGLSMLEAPAAEHHSP